MSRSDGKFHKISLINCDIQKKHTSKSKLAPVRGGALRRRSLIDTPSHTLSARARGTFFKSIKWWRRISTFLSKVTPKRVQKSPREGKAYRGTNGRERERERRSFCFPQQNGAFVVPQRCSKSAQPGLPTLTQLQKNTKNV